MVDRHFADAELAALYDACCPRSERDDLDFYLPLVMRAGAVLDVGCGTGTLLAEARAGGHTGRLCGLDPADGMLRVARRCEGVEWLHGDLSTIPFDGEFDLVVMSGHAFQVWGDDDEIARSLGAVRSALADGGRFAFESRNPTARAWEAWTPDASREIVDATGAVVRVTHDVERPVTGDVVSFTTTFTSERWALPRVSHSTLRFLGADALGARLAAAGFEVELQFGDWDRSPLTDSSPEIVTIARPRRSG